MNHNQIDILKNLSWDSTAEQKKSGFIAALQENEHKYLLQPIDYPSSWDNAAIVFLMLSDEEIEPYLFNLLEWIQDINWPGATWILDRLQRVSAEFLVRPLESAAKMASNNNDEIWLGAISILIANPHMNKLLNADIFKLLKPFAVKYHNWDFDKIAEHFRFS